MRIIIFSVIMITLNNAYAASAWQNFWETIEKKVHQLPIVGKILEERDDELSLPALPVLTYEGKKNERCEKYKSKKMNLSPEMQQKYDNLYIREIYSCVRGQEPSSEDYHRWLNTLGQGASREGIYRALVLDGTYRSYENYLKRTPNPRVLKFSLEFLSKYIGEEFEQSEIEGMSFHTIKRVLTEKALVMLDHLCFQEEDVYRWYAVLSAELAVSGRNAWTSQFRQNSSAKFHYQWASKVDEQTLKSEVMIKMHKTLNALQQQH